MTNPVTSSRPPVTGITQGELTTLGSLLRDMGFSQDGVVRITTVVQEVVAQAAFQATGAVATAVQKLRADEQAYWNAYTNNTLLNVMNQLRASQNAFGYVSVNTVIATIQSAMLAGTQVSDPARVQKPGPAIKAIVN